MRERVFLTWVGSMDMAAVRGSQENPEEVGPTWRIVQLVADECSEVILLYDYRPRPRDREESEAQRRLQLQTYARWLADQHGVQVTPRLLALNDPTGLAGLQEVTFAEVEDAERRFRRQHGFVPRLVFGITGGTPAMQAITLLIAGGIEGAQVLAAPRRGEPATRVDLAGLARVRSRLLVGLTAARPIEATAFDALVGWDDPVMAPVRAVAERYAATDLPVLIEGPTGTGKTSLARAIHEAGPRAKKAFEVVNCEELAPTLVESELFGHVKGAFTGAANEHIGRLAQANGGTLFIDEIGELRPEVQVKLLRFFDARTIRPVGGTRDIEVDVRILCATHRDLAGAVRAGVFRADLFYRLLVGRVRMPSLAERSVGLERLIDEQCRALALRLGQGAPLQISSAARDRLRQHAWPGNARELHSTLLRAFVEREGDGPLTVADVERGLIPVGVEGAASSVSLAEIGRHGSLPAWEAARYAEAVKLAWQASKGNRAEGGRLLGISRQAFSAAVERFGLDG